MTSLRPIRASRARPGLTTATVLCLLLTACTPSPQPGPSSSGCSVQKVVYIGDSITNGTDNDSGVDARFPALIQKSLGGQAVVLASNGSGYIARGPAADAHTFPEQAELVPADAQVVIMMGSRNDMPSADKPDTITQAAAAAMDAIKARAPHAKIQVIGPPWINQKPSSGIIAVNAAVEAAAKRASLPYVDSLEAGWFAETDNLTNDGRSKFIASDRIHPNDAGHRYLADRIAPIVQSAACPTTQK